MQPRNRAVRRTAPLCGGCRRLAAGDAANTCDTAHKGHCRSPRRRLGDGKHESGLASGAVPTTGHAAAAHLSYGQSRPSIGAVCVPHTHGRSWKRTRPLSLPAKTAGRIKVILLLSAYLTTNLQTVVPHFLQDPLTIGQSSLAGRFSMRTRVL